MDTQTVLEVIDSAVLTKHVHSPFEQRSGLMFFGPPATLKTTFISNVLSEHYDALLISDINIQTLMKLRSDFRSNRYSTLAFTEFSKLYARRGETSSNLETSIMALVEEGFTLPSFVDSRISVGKARCMVIGAMTESFYEEHYSGWHDSGFLRRFLWCNINVSNQYLLMESVKRWELLDLGSYKSKTPGNRFIKMSVSDKENEELELMIKDQPGTVTPFVLLKKILSVLHWKYDKEDPKKAINILRDFAPCLSKEGTDIVLTERKADGNDK